MADDGLISLVSKHSVADTIDRLVQIAETNGLTVFARIDHAKNAKDAGLELRPTQPLIFGNPKVGTDLMVDNQVSGLDLPYKTLAWEAADGQVRLSYVAPDWLAGRHHLGAASAQSVAALKIGMGKIAALAAS